MKQFELGGNISSAQLMSWVLTVDDPPLSRIRRWSVYIVTALYELIAKLTSIFSLPLITSYHINGMLYIGKTGRPLGGRIRDHLYDMRKNDLSKPVS